MRTLNITEDEPSKGLGTIALTKREKDALRNFVEVLHQSLGENLVRIILFGSKARGEAKRGSDIDLLVILRNRDIESSHEIYKAASRTDLRWRVDISPKVYSLEEYQQRREIGAPFSKEVERDGVLLT